MNNNDLSLLTQDEKERLLNDINKEKLIIYLNNILGNYPSLDKYLDIEDKSLTLKKD